MLKKSNFCKGDLNIIHAIEFQEEMDSQDIQVLWNFKNYGHVEEGSISIHYSPLAKIIQREEGSIAISFSLPERLMEKKDGRYMYLRIKAIWEGFSRLCEKKGCSHMYENMRELSIIRFVLSEDIGLYIKAKSMNFQTGKYIFSNWRDVTIWAMDQTHHMAIQNVISKTFDY